MGLKFSAMTEEQIDRLGLLEGKFKFRVVESEDTQNKDGDPQIAIKIKVSDGNSSSVIKTYLSTNGQFMLRRLRHFCRSTGLMDLYNSEDVNAPDVLGSEGIVELGIQKGGEMNDGSGRRYADKTAVLDFIGEEAPTEDKFNDDINF